MKVYIGSMNTKMEFNERQRFVKNKNKVRRHEKRLKSEKIETLDMKNEKKREMQDVKNFKLRNNIEKNPWINELRGFVESEDDWDVLNEYYYGEE